jgi:predicted nucleic acid-binding protein
MQYLLDTSICVFFLRGKLELDKIIREKGTENCFISEITLLNFARVLKTVRIQLNLIKLLIYL